MVKLSNFAKNFSTVKGKTIVIGCILLFTFVSCQHHDSINQVIESLDSLCEENPRLALNQLDSVKSEVCHAEEWTLRKCQLLYTKAQYKSNIPLTTDSVMRLVVDFFDKTGEKVNSIEANYYLACAYDDMHDSPRCVRYANKALGLSEDAGIPNPQVHLRINSLLAYVHRKQLRAREALEDAQRGYELARKHNLLDPIYVMDVATAYYQLRDTLYCIHFYKEALEEIKKRQDGITKYVSCLCEIMEYSPNLGNRELADECFCIVQQFPDNIRPHNFYSSLAHYYYVYGPTDSAIVYNKIVCSDSSSFRNQRAATHSLMNIYYRRGDYEVASFYGQRYAAINDALRARLQLEQTRNLDNEYQYQRDLEAESEAYRKATKTEERALAIVSISAIFIIMALVVAIFLMLRKQRLERLLEIQDKEINSLEEERSGLIETALSAKIENSHSEIIDRIREATKGYVTLQGRDWNSFYAAMNQEYPDFERQLRAYWPKIGKRDRQIVYLMKAGLSSANIAHLLKDIDRSTVYRKCNNFKERLGSLLSFPNSLNR